MALETASDSFVVGVANAGARINDNVHRRQLMLMVPERFADDTLQPIAPNGIAGGASPDRQPQPGMRKAVAANENRKQRIGETSRILVDAIELRLVM
ncbi:MAG TPA: hypothetical protein VIL28_03950 [Steroidobacteraceae bacterium]